MRLDAAGFLIGGQRHAPPRERRRAARALRAALAAAPRPQPEIPGVPLAGGLVGFAAYDVVRHFERLHGAQRRRRGRAGAALRRAALACWCSIT